MKTRQFLLGMLCLFLSGIAIACPKSSELQALEQSNDIEGLKQLHKQIHNCPPSSKNHFDFYIAHALYRDMRQKNMQGAQLTSRLNEIISLNDDYWPAHYDLAEEKSKVVSLKLVKESFDHYAKALKLINNISITSDQNAPPDQFINQLQLRLSHVHNVISLEEMDPSFIPTDSLRSGGYRTRTRGVQAIKLHLPIRFGFNKHILEGNDLKNAQNILKEYQINTPRSLTIIGHTDRVGTHKINDAISLRRANSLKTYLSQNGLNTQINVVGKGKREPIALTPFERQQLSQDQVDQLNRRLDIITN